MVPVPRSVRPTGGFSTTMTGRNTSRGGKAVDTSKQDKANSSTVVRNEIVESDDEAKGAQTLANLQLARKAKTKETEAEKTRLQGKGKAKATANESEDAIAEVATKVSCLKSFSWDMN